MGDPPRLSKLHHAHFESGVFLLSSKIQSQVLLLSSAALMKWDISLFSLHEVCSSAQCYKGRFTVDLSQFSGFASKTCKCYDVNI